jgi:hypothetical protein
MTFGIVPMDVSVTIGLRNEKEGKIYSCPTIKKIIKIFKKLLDNYLFICYNVVVQKEQITNKQNYLN